MTNPHMQAAEEEAAKILANLILTSGWDSCNKQTQEAFRTDAGTIIMMALPHIRAQVLEDLTAHLETLPEDGLAAYNAAAIRQYAKDTTLMNYETEEQSDLKNEISDYLGQYHGGHAEGSDLDCIEAAEHIVTALAEPAIRAMIAKEIRDFAENSGVGAYGDYGPPAIAVSDATSIALGEKP